MMKYEKELIQPAIKHPYAKHLTLNFLLKCRMSGNGLPLGLQGQVAPLVMSCDCIKLLDCIFFKAVLYSIFCCCRLTA